jgi:hypothetical protein
MDRIEFFGTVETSSPAVAADVLRRWLHGSGHTGEVSVSGAELSYADATLRVRCHEVDLAGRLHRPQDAPFFQIEGQATALPGGSSLRLGVLTRLCQAAAAGQDLDAAQREEDELMAFAAAQRRPGEYGPRLPGRPR